MFRQLVKHTLYGVTGAVYSLAYDVLPTLLYNMSQVRILTEDVNSEAYVINSERLFTLFVFATLLSVSQDCVFPRYNPAFFLLRNQLPKGGKAFRDELDEIGFLEAEIPENLRDMYISMCMMNDPVILLGDGETYERQDILRWLERTGTSPATGERLFGVERSVIPNMDKRREIEVFVRGKVSRHQAYIASEALKKAKENDSQYEVQVAVLR